VGGWRRGPCRWCPVGRWWVGGRAFWSGGWPSLYLVAELEPVFAELEPVFAVLEPVGVGGFDGKFGAQVGNWGFGVGRIDAAVACLGLEGA
jgi:hypothetical protein